MLTRAITGQLAQRQKLVQCLKAALQEEETRHAGTRTGLQTAQHQAEEAER